MTISLSKSETPLHATEQDRKKTVEKESGLPTECERAWSSPRPVGTFNVGNQAEKAR